MALEKEPEYYKDLVTKSPKVAPEDQTEWERKYGHEQFGNNFYFLFLAIRAFRTQINADNLFVNVYMSKALREGEKFQKFVAENEELLTRIFAAMEGTDIYSQLLHYVIKLYNEHTKDRDFSAGDAFAELGVEEVGMYYWRILNPLLEQAAEEMKKYDIDPKPFFG